MSIKLTDTQLVMLSAAAQREDRCIVASPSLKGAAAQKIATKLVAAGLAKEIKAKPGAHVWRCDHANGQAYALKLTRPNLPVLFTTGYSRNILIHDGCLDPEVRLLAKPYSPHDLAVAVRTSLDAAK